MLQALPLLVLQSIPTKEELRQYNNAFFRVAIKYHSIDYTTGILCVSLLFKAKWRFLFEGCFEILVLGTDGGGDKHFQNEMG